MEPKKGFASAVFLLCALLTCSVVATVSRRPQRAGMRDRVDPTAAAELYMKNLYEQRTQLDETMPAVLCFSDAGESDLCLPYTSIARYTDQSLYTVQLHV